MKSMILPLLMAACIMTVGCRKDPLKNLSSDESRIYITKHSDSVSFNAYRTFSIADSVAVIDNNQLVEKGVADVDVAYIDAVKQMMQQRGYTYVNHTQNPDLGINVSRIYNTYSGVYDYGYLNPYYDYYWDPYYWGYGGYGYYFPSYYYGVYSITDGAISIDVFDLKDAQENNKQIRAVWSGLVRGSGSFSPANASSSVKALFDQSAYFKR